MPPWEEPFLGTELHGPSRNLKSTIAACSCHTILTPLKHCTVQYHTEGQQTYIIKTDPSQKDIIWRSDKAHSVADRLYPHISQVRDTVTTPFPSQTGFMGYCCLIWESLFESKPNVEHFLKLNTCCSQVRIIHWDFLFTEQSKLIWGSLRAWPSMQHTLYRNVYSTNRDSVHTIRQ